MLFECEILLYSLLFEELSRTREGRFFVFELKDSFDNWVYSSVYSMKLIPTSCQLPWQQHWLTEEFRSWTSSKRSPGSSWGGQTFGVWIHWLSIRFRTSLEWHPLKFKQPSSILRGIHIFGNQRRPLIANFMARLNAVNGQKGYIVVLLRNTQCASLRIAYKNIL